MLVKIYFSPVIIKRGTILKYPYILKLHTLVKSIFGYISEVTRGFGVAQVY